MRGQTYNGLRGRRERVWTEINCHRAQWRAVVNMIMNIRVSQKVGNSFACWATISYPKRTLLQGVSHETPRHWTIFKSKVPPLEPLVNWASSVHYAAIRSSSLKFILKSFPHIRLGLRNGPFEQVVKKAFLLSSCSYACYMSNPSQTSNLIPHIKQEVKNTFVF
jgi:hypothetical protein